MGTFVARTNELLDKVGSGKIEASVRVDQAYAEFQHERTDLKHPRGGGAHYLRDPLYKNLPKNLRQIANQMFDRPMRTIFVDLADDFSGYVADNAPVFLGDLRASGEPRVKEGGRFVWRGTAMPRLNKRYARGKQRLWHSIYGEEV